MRKAEVIKRAIGHFILGWSGISGILGLGIVIYATSPTVSEAERVAIIAIFVATWSGSSLALLLGLKRELTPAKLDAHGLTVGRRKIPYDSISAVDWMPRKYVFRITTRTRGRRVLISKIGIEDEEDFLRKLNERVSAGRESVIESQRQW